VLGQLPDDVLRTQSGERLHGAVEEVRPTALRFRRDEDPGAARRLDAPRRKLTRDDTIGVASVSDANSLPPP
jgi:phosphoenolpyruvate carboxylase